MVIVSRMAYLLLGWRVERQVYGSHSQTKQVGRPDPGPSHVTQKRSTLMQPYHTYAYLEVLLAAITNIRSQREGRPRTLLHHDFRSCLSNIILPFHHPIVRIAAFWYQ